MIAGNLDPDEEVWVGPKGVKYHTNRGCHALKKNRGEPRRKRAVVLHHDMESCNICDARDEEDGSSEEGTVGALEPDRALWHTATGRAYHLDEDCPLAPPEAESTTADLVGDSAPVCKICISRENGRGRTAAGDLDPDEAVWVAPTSENFHTDRDCRGLAESKSEPRRKRAAVLHSDMELCSICNGPDTMSGDDDRPRVSDLDGETALWYTRDGDTYHTSKLCAHVPSGAERTKAKFVKDTAHVCKKCRSDDSPASMVKVLQS